MDILTLRKAMGYADDIGAGGSEKADALEEAIQALAGDVSAGDLDGDTAATLLINAFRQHIWQNESDALVCEEGTATLTNTGEFPFNTSQKSVALTKTQKATKYVVVPELVSSVGNAGDLVVSDKQVNGFKVAYTGSASTAVVKYIVIGGIIK